MAMLFCEGFEWLTSSTTRTEWETYGLRYWYGMNMSGASSTPFVTSRGTDIGLELDNSNAITTMKLQDPDGDTTLVFGFYYKTPATFSAGNWVQIFCGVNEQCVLEINTDGTVDFLNSSTILATSTYAFSTSNEYYIEFKIVISDSVGTIDMKVADLTANGDDTDPSSEWSASGLDSRRSTVASETAWDQVSFQGIGANCVIDDIYVCDGTGGKNDDFLGNTYVETLEPDGAGASTQLTPSTGSNWENVDAEGNIPDDDTTYNTADADAETDLYSLADPVKAGGPHAVQAQVMCRVTQGNPRDIRIPIRNGSTTSEGSSVQILSYDQYVGRWRIVELDPDTGSDWASASGIQMGIKRQA